MTLLNRDRPSVFLDTAYNTVHYRPSAIGGCMRGLVALRLGMKPVPFDPQSLTMMNEGNIHEPFIAEDWGKGHGGVLVRKSLSCQVSWECPGAMERFGVRAVLSGTADGFWMPEPGTIWDVGESGGFYGIEIKAMGKWSFEKMDSEGVDPLYQWQISSYWAAMEQTFNTKLLGFIFLYKNRDSGVINHLLIEQPPIPFSELERRIHQVEQEAKDIRESSCNVNEATCDRDGHWCKWKHIGCGDLSERADDDLPFELDDKPLPPSLVPGDIERISEMVAEDLKLTRQIGELEDRKKMIRRELEEKMTGVERLKFGVATIGWTQMASRFDEKGFWASYPDLYRQFEEVKKSTGKTFMRPGKKYLWVKKTGGNR